MLVVGLCFHTGRFPSSFPCQQLFTGFSLPSSRSFALSHKFIHYNSDNLLIAHGAFPICMFMGAMLNVLLFIDSDIVSCIFVKHAKVFLSVCTTESIYSPRPLSHEQLKGYYCPLKRQESRKVPLTWNTWHYVAPSAKTPSDATCTGKLLMAFRHAHRVQRAQYSGTEFVNCTEATQQEILTLSS